MESSSSLITLKVSTLNHFLPQFMATLQRSVTSLLWRMFAKSKWYPTFKRATLPKVMEETLKGPERLLHGVLTSWFSVHVANNWKKCFMLNKLLLGLFQLMCLSSLLYRKVSNVFQYPWEQDYEYSCYPLATWDDWAFKMISPNGDVFVSLIYTPDFKFNMKK